MLIQESTPEMVEGWKEVCIEYRNKLLPNRRSGKEIVEHLKNKYLLEELNDDNAKQVVIDIYYITSHLQISCLWE